MQPSFSLNISEVMKRKYQTRFLLSVFTTLFFLLLFSCSNNQPENGKIVATLGSEKITFPELEESLWLNPRYSKRAPLKTVRENQLNFLIRERRYYLAAKRVGLESDTLIQPKMKYIKAQEVLKSYLDIKFLKKIHVDDKELRQGLAMYEKVIKVQHLYFRDKEQAEKAEIRLANGESFEQIARQIYRDEALQNSGGEVGYVTFGDLDPGIEKAIYSLKEGEISRPVASRYGYHILRVLDIQPNRSIELLKPETKTEQIRQIIRRRKVDALIREHLSQLAGGQKIRINNRVIDFLVACTKQVMGKEYEEPGLFKPVIKNKELLDIQLGLEDVKNEVLARFGDREMKVKDFLHRLREMPPFHRPYLSTRNRMVQAIIDMMRNDLLLKEAYVEGIDRLPEVRDKYERLQKTFLAEEFRRRLESGQFKKDHPRLREKYQLALQKVAQKYPPRIYYTNLFGDVKNPDSIMVDAPIPLVMKNRYQW